MSRGATEPCTEYINSDQFTLQAACRLHERGIWTELSVKGCEEEGGESEEETRLIE